MPSKQFHYRWEWELESSPEILWPLVTDTNKFNRDAGLPPIESRSENGKRFHRFKTYGMTVEWEENPFEWVYPRQYGVHRRYRKGPFVDVRVTANLIPKEGSGTLLIYEVWAEARTFLDQMTIPIILGKITPIKFGKVFKKYDAQASQKSEGGIPQETPFLTGGEDRLAVLKEKMSKEGLSEPLVERLVHLIQTGDPLQIARLRPYAWADAWGFSRREVLELFLHATRAGLLELRWEVMCPMCRGPNESKTSLKELQNHIHCPGCNIDYRVNFERLVELVFRPNPSIRQAEEKMFCMGNPQMAPHVVIRQHVDSRGESLYKINLENGRYIARTRDLPGGQTFMIAPVGKETFSAIASPEGWASEEPVLNPSIELIFKNETPQEQLFILERMAWSDKAATAAEVIALQKFRDLFSQEVLRPDQQISVGSQVILFTDLKSSTRLYREIGDAPAFGLVMNHFDILREAISEEGGSLVKTIGDAVMAVFRRPVAALKAMLKAQEVLAHPLGGERPLLLKAGIHHGPCIAVTLNDRLDYFGTTINMAARLESLSSGGDIVISAQVLEDPEVKEWVTQSDIRIEPVEAKLKGFDEEMKLWRLKNIKEVPNLIRE